MSVRSVVQIALLAVAVPLGSVSYGQVEKDGPGNGGGAPRQAETDWTAVFRQLGEEHRALMETRLRLATEMDSPQRTRPLKDIGAEFEENGRSLEAVDRRRALAEEEMFAEDTRRRENDALVVVGTGVAVALSERSHAKFLAQTDNAKRSEWPKGLVFKSKRVEQVVAELASHRAEVAFFDAPLKEDQERLLATAFAGQETPQRSVLGRAVLVIVVHRTNKTPSLTLAQIERLYRHEIRRWADVGGPPQTVARLGTTSPALSARMFGERVLHRNPIAFPDEVIANAEHPMDADEYLAKLREQADRFPGHGPFPRFMHDGRVLEEVGKDAAAIGYCLLLPNHKLPADVRVLSLSGEVDKPGMSPVTADGNLVPEYPLVQTLWVLQRPDSSECARAFVRFLCSKENSGVLKECGIWPEADIQRSVAEERLPMLEAHPASP
jgi:ABC-type phosphate transport system substrate-binding protein